MRRKIFALTLVVLSILTFFVAGCNVKISYTIEFYSDGEIYKTVSTDGEVIEMPKDPKKEGLVFDGWYTEEDGKGDKLTINKILDQPLSEKVNLKVYAHFLEVFEVTFIQKTDGDEIFEKVSVVEGEKVEEREVTYIPNDMLFVGWCEWESFKKYDFNKGVTENITLFAFFESKFVNVTFDFKAEGIENITSSVERYTKISKPETTQNGDDILVGWYTDESFLNEFDFGKEITGETILYAKWSSKFVEVTFDYRQTGMENETVLVERGQKVNKITPENYPEYLEFLGWSSSKYYGELWDFEKDVVEKELTLYAQWEDLSGQFAIVDYFVDGEIKYTEYTQTGKKITYTPREIEGYTFAGWYREATFKTKWDEENNYVLTEELKLYAKFTPNVYNISYNVENKESYGDMFEDTKVVTGEWIEVYGLFKENYVHEGWIIRNAKTNEFLKKLENSDGCEFNFACDVIIEPQYRYAFVFTLNGTGDGYIIESNGFKGSVLTLPSEYEGKPVVETAYWAFRNNNSIQKLIIPDSIKVIGKESFSACYGLTEVVMGNGVEKISDGAFDGCDILSKINFSSSLKEIGNSAFSGCKFTDITLPNSVKKIGGSCFSGNQSLSSIDLAQVEEIGGYAFSSCPMISVARIPSTVKVVGKNLFSGGNTLILCESERQPEGFDEEWNYNGYTVVWGGSGKVVTQNDVIYLLSGGKATVLKGLNATTITIPQTVTFEGESYEVVEIAQKAFSKLSSLTTISIPSTVKKVGLDAFAGSNSLVYTVDEGTYYLGNSQNKYLVLAKFSSNTPKIFEVKAETKVVMGISDDYTYVTEFSSITFEEGCSLEYIGENAFHIGGNAKTREILLPSEIDCIETNAFYTYHAAKDYKFLVESEQKPSGWKDGWAYHIFAVYYGVDFDNLVKTENETYIIKDDSATLITLDIEEENYSVAESILVGEKEYLVTAIGKNAFATVNINNLFISQTVDFVDFNEPMSPSFVGKIEKLFIEHGEVPTSWNEGWNEIANQTIVGITKDRYIITSDAEYLAYSNYAVAFDYNGKSKTFAVPEFIEVDGEKLTVSHIERRFLSRLNDVSVVLRKSVTNIPKGKTYGYGVSFYTEHETSPSGWEKGWNETYNSNMPIYYGVKNIPTERQTYKFVTDGTAVEEMNEYFITTQPTTTISGKYFWGWYSSESYEEEVLFPYFGESCTLYARFETDQKQDGRSYETAYEIFEGVYTTVNITTPGQEVYFKFRTLDSMMRLSYLFKSRGSLDTYGFIRFKSSYSYSEVASVDGGGEGGNFSTTQSLSSDYVYYLVVKLVDKTETGSFEIIISQI